MLHRRRRGYRRRQGRALLPGLIGAHERVVAASHDLIGQAQQPPPLVGAQSSRIMRCMLQRGFSSVRDAGGGADFGLQEAVARGLYEWPSLLIASLPISQTGGHANMRPKGVRVSMFCACAGIGPVGAIADIDVFSLHAAVRCKANDRKRLEQLRRYITRPALSDERVQLNAGQGGVELETPW